VYIRLLLCCSEQANQNKAFGNTKEELTFGMPYSNRIAMLMPGNVGS
jgi:hypothetical protein